MEKQYSLRRPHLYIKALRCIALGQGKWMNSVGYAKAQVDELPSMPNRDVEAYVRMLMLDGSKAAVDSSALDVEFKQSITDFFEVVNEGTIVGKLSTLRRLPFHVRYLAITGGATATWVGEKKPKPFTSIELAGNKIEPRKLLGQILLTDEATRAGGTAAENAFSRDLIRAVRALKDRAFIDPTISEVSGVSPASVTNGVTAVPSSGSTLANLTDDLGTLLDAFAGNLDSAAFVTDPTTAVRLALVGGAATLDVGPKGGTLFGLPLITSRSSPRDSSGGQLALVDAEGIAYASEGAYFGQAMHATVEVASSPTDPVDASTTQVSLWQHNLAALKYEEACNWHTERAGSVALLDQLFPN